MRVVHAEMLLTLAGIFLGLVGFVAFTFCLSLYTAGLLALYTGVLAFLAFHLHRLHWKNALAEWYTVEMMEGFKVFGLCGVLVGLAYLAWCLFWQLYRGIPVVPILKSTIVVSIWALLALLFGGLLYIGARKYANMREENQSLLSRDCTTRRYQ